MNQQEAVNMLKAHNFKITDKRLDIIRFFEEADGYRTAKDLNTYMESTHPNISFDTVYRNLHLYHEMGLLESTTLQGEKHFRLRCSHHHHHHFICSHCGGTKEIDMCPMEQLKKALAGYQINDHKFEIYGLCPSCQSV
ncbi:Fur family transcriptional regulator [Lentibacillus saliphilus]|uniref:Fur family transcriptional regulator n=1 Tax=Lentibacillus saliphilus TaxID=2737028 RepID=UPI001C30BA04|nr:Fur family transcriptional regulator [Lentibacillus saliphilus]